MDNQGKKKNQSNITIDLHGMKHNEVFIVVEDFVLNNQNQFPLKIITGNSHKTKSIVINVLKKHNFNYSIGDYYNLGYIDVLN